MATQTLTFREAIIAGIADAMREDERVILLGEDIAEAGGVFKTTEGLVDEFGEGRVRDTPISETAFVGAALGLATTGYRPIVEIMFADFLAVCLDQIVNSIAKHKFMSGGRVNAPLVIRTACGGGVQFGAQHSQTAESWLLPFPGLKIALPSSPAEAYGMIRAAVRDDNPVVVFEHKAMLGAKGPVNIGDDGIVDLNGPTVLREGTDLTLVASLAMVPKAVSAADELSQDGISAEVIDVRVLRPFEPSVIIRSVNKTGRLVVVEEQHRLGGWGAEVVASVTEDALAGLKAAPKRVTLPDHPLPFAASLEQASIPDIAKIKDAAQSVLQ